MSAEEFNAYVEAAMVGCPRCGAVVGKPCTKRICKNGYRNCDYAICSTVIEVEQPHLERARQGAAGGTRMTVSKEKAQALLDGATPGPWRADDEHGLLKDSKPAWVVSRTDKQGSYLGDLGYIPQDMAIPCGEPSPQEQADALLMAAAPDLAATVIEQADALERLRTENTLLRKLAEVNQPRQVVTVAELEALPKGRPLRQSPPRDLGRPPTPSAGTARKEGVMTTGKIKGHFIHLTGGTSASCSCGGSRGTVEAVLEHALTLNVEGLHAEITADPKSPPDLKARADALLVQVHDEMTRPTNSVRFYRDPSGQYRWTITAAENGEVIAASTEGYVRRIDAIANLNRVTGITDVATVLLPPDGDEKDIRDLIERGSLGTPEAKAIRATVSAEEVARVLARAEELRLRDEGPDSQADEGDVT